MLAGLIKRNASLKTKVVLKDEFEKGGRKLLNFGHTLGHALETQYSLSHGEAISIGMNYAARLSKKFLGFKEEQRLSDLLQKYNLPVSLSFNRDRVMEVLKMDKKKIKNSVNFILLRKIGKALIQPIPLEQLYETLS